jgi:Mn2+/Fe2+ NRAMP family transporter
MEPAGSTSPPADKNPRARRGVGEHLTAPVSVFRPQAQTLASVPGSPKLVGWLRKTLKIFGPGLVTGAADDDPSGIATYSSVGAQFGYAMLWTMPLIYPFMAAIQEISARLGRVTGRGIAGNIRRFYPPWILYLTVVLLLVANIINIGADIGAMGAAVNLLVGGPTLLYCVLFALVSVLLQVFVPYKKLFRYFEMVNSLSVRLRRHGLCRSDKLEGGASRNLHPQYFREARIFNSSDRGFGNDNQSVPAFLAVRGRSRTNGELPRGRSAQKGASASAGTIPADQDRYLRWNGILKSHRLLYHSNDCRYASRPWKTDIDTAAQAAVALRPIAGAFASLLFSLGVIGTGLLALPVLGGSAAYAVGEALHWPVGLERKAKEAKAFYAVLALATLVGLALNFTKVDAIKALVWAAIINGVTAAPVMCLMMLLASRRKVIRKFTLPAYLKILGWLAAAIMALAAAGMFLTSGQ